MDRLIWYLRIVHSVDYYSATVFPSEDCMPHRCGIITGRGQKPNAATQEEGTATLLSSSLSLGTIQLSVACSTEKLESVISFSHEHYFPVVGEVWKKVEIELSFYYQYVQGLTLSYCSYIGFFVWCLTHKHLMFSKGQLVSVMTS